MLEAKRGDSVSLNLPKRSYFFQSEGGINLGNEGIISTKIPGTITDEQLKQINMAIRNGHLVLGEPAVIADDVDRDSDIKKVVEGGRNSVDDWIYRVREDKSLSNSIKLYRIEKLIEFEKAGKNRTSVLIKAERALGVIGGISKVEETEKEKVEIKITPTEQVTDEPEKTLEIK